MEKINLGTIIKESPSYFILDLIIWFFSHNIPLLMAYLLKLYFDTNYKNKLFAIIVIYTLLFISRLFLIKIGAKIDINAQHNWSKVMYEKIINKCIESKSVTDSMNKEFIDLIQNDVGSIVAIISYGIDTICNVLASVIAFIVIATINIYVAFIILIVPIIIFFILNFLKDILYNKSNAMRENESHLINIYQDIIIKSRKIRISSLENTFYNLYGKYLSKNKNAKLTYGKFSILIDTINQLLVDSNVVLILLSVIYFSTFSTGDIALLISYSFIINDLSTYISTFVVIYNELKVNLDFFNRKLNYKLDNKFNISNIDIIVNKLEYASINVLVGKNGSGKSQILKEIAKKKECALILEKSTVLSENLYKNIVIDNDPTMYYKVKNLLSLQDLESRDKLINKELSGGQSDRISLARALMGDNKMILIDNNLLSVDNKIRDSILKTFEESQITFVMVDTEYREEYKNYNIIYI